MSERKKVEKAEDSIYQGYQFDTIREAQDFVDDLKKDHVQWWEEHLGQVQKIKIEMSDAANPTTPGKKFGIKTQQQGFDIIITTSDVKKLQEFPIVCNLVRMALPDSASLEGKEYRKLLLKSVKALLNEEFHDDLKRSYEEQGLAL